MTSRLTELVAFEQEISSSPFLGQVIFFLKLANQKGLCLDPQGDLDGGSLDRISAGIPGATNDGIDLARIDALCNIGKFIRDRNGYRELTSKGKLFLNDHPEMQLLVLFQFFWNALDWQFFVTLENHAEIARRLQDNQVSCLALLVAFPDGVDSGEFCKVLAEKLMDDQLFGFDQSQLKVAERVVYDVLLKHLELFGFVTLIPATPDRLGDHVSLTPLGRIVSNIVTFNT